MEFRSCQMQFDSNIINTFRSSLYRLIGFSIQHSLFNNSNMNNNHFIAFNASMVHLIITGKCICIVYDSRAFQFFIIPILLLPDFFFLLHFEQNLNKIYVFFSYADAGPFFGYAYYLLLYKYITSSTMNALK